MYSSPLIFIFAYHPQLDGMQELFELASAFENSVVPQEYGTDRDDKRRIGSKMCKALLEKIKYDLTITMVRYM
jgi:Histidine phosphatase superfamily (branch 2)